MSQNKNLKKSLENDAEFTQKDQFNNVTNSVKVENQNQHHNVKKQSLGPNTKR